MRNKYKKAWKEFGKRLMELSDTKSDEMRVAIDYEHEEKQKELEAVIFFSNQVHDIYTDLLYKLNLKKY